jgi:cyclophilin family peptidyl-prolyl cis-trans isomerase
MKLLHNNLKKIVLFILLLSISCDEKKDIIVKKVKTTKKELKKNNLENEFRLSDDNVMEFFLDYDKNHKENKVRIFTDYGEIDILLFENTKFHRSNFIYLTKKNYFQNTQFYRVINNFIIQGGNSDNRKISKKRKKIGRYLLPNDLNKGHTHKRGMVSMPSSLVDNPYKMASPFEFFIVQKKNGAHHLDGDYTVFGKVTKGMDTVDKIASRPTDNRDWPIDNVYIKKVEIID